jgi:peptide/nickel transport system ATP-binding protein
MSHLLEVRDLSVSFAGPVLAVSGLSFSVAADEVLAVVGESGCGKTLTGLSILGLEPRGATVGGSVLFRDCDLRAAGQRRLREVRGAEIAMIFAEPMTALNPSLTVGYQMTEVLRRHLDLRGQAAKKRAAELFDLVRMPSPERQLHAYPHQLSGGMRQRVMIAMAVACSPALLIADEPTTSLDVSVQAQIIDLLGDLRERLHMSILLISHNLGLVSRLADRVLVMYAGHKVEEASASALFEDPLHPYTSGLLAAIPRPGTDRDTSRLTAIEGQVPLLRAAPSECVFSPRCPHVRAECREGQPALRGVENSGHAAACVLAAAS